MREVLLLRGGFLAEYLCEQKLFFAWIARRVRDGVPLVHLGFLVLAEPRWENPRVFAGDPRMFSRVGGVAPVVGFLGALLAGRKLISVV